LSDVDICSYSVPCSHQEKNEDILSINLPALFSLPEFNISYTEEEEEEE
jgi:hypothetical protein